MMMGIRYYYTTALLLSIGKRKDIYLREQDIYIYIYILFTGLEVRTRKI